MRPIDVICMGRVAVDLYAEEIGVSLDQVNTFKKYLGGCAGNIAVGTSRLGLRSAMLSCVGTDAMGLFLKKELQKEGVDISQVKETENHLTGLVLLGIEPPHTFPLIFYRRDCADMQLKAEHINPKFFAQAKSLLITGTGLSTEAMRLTTQHAIQVAKSTKTMVIFDIDFRPVLWNLTHAGNGESRYAASQSVSSHYQCILPQCDLIVGTEEEVLIASGKENLDDAIAAIRHLSKAPIVLKRGERGAYIYFKDKDKPLSTAPFSVKVLNVLGAGDAFMSGLLRGLLRDEPWEVAATYANASGAIVVMHHGCAPAMPTFSEMQQFISDYHSSEETHVALSYS